MANRATPITAASFILTIKDVLIAKIALCAAAATSTLEIFEGMIGTIATKAIAVGGTLYAVGDTITLVQAGGGVQAVFTVATVDAPETGVITGLTLVTGGTGYIAGTTYATTTNSVAGSGCTVTASTVSDAGTSKGKISTTANLSAELEMNTLLVGGASLRITGASAQGYIYHE